MKGARVFHRVAMTLAIMAITVGCSTSESPEKQAATPRSSSPSTTAPQDVLMIEPTRAPRGSLVHVSSKPLRALEGGAKYELGLYTTSGENLQAPGQAPVTPSGNAIDRWIIVPDVHVITSEDIENPPELALGNYEIRITLIPNSSVPAGPDNSSEVIATGQFEVISADLGQAYPHALNTLCGVDITYFDGGIWRAQPPIAKEAAPPPFNAREVNGTFMMVDQGHGKFVVGDAPAINFEALADEVDVPWC